MTVYLTTGQMLRLERGGGAIERRYFGTLNLWPNVDTTLYSAGWATTIDPDAIGTPWVEITTSVYDGKTAFHEVDDGDVGKWSVDLAGHSWDSRYIQEEHAVLCVWRLYPDVENADSWSNWRVWWLGYIKNKKSDGDARNEYAWTAQVEGVSQYVEKKEAEPEILSRTDLCLNQPVTASALLQDMILEAGTGEFLGVPENNAQNLVDGDDAVPVIWNNIPTANPETFTPIATGTAQRLKISEAYIQPAAGYSDDHQWFEIVCVHEVGRDLANSRVRIYDRNNAVIGSLYFPHTDVTMGAWVSSGSALAEAIYGTPNVAPMGYHSNAAVTNPGNLTAGLAVRIDQESMVAQADQSSPQTFFRPNSADWANHASGAAIQKQGETVDTAQTSLGTREFFVFCANRRRFDELFSLQPGVKIAAWQGDQAHPENNTLVLDTVAGRIALEEPVTGVPGGYLEIDRVSYTTVGPAEDDTVAGAWIGPRVELAGSGKSIKRSPIGGGIGSAQDDSNSSGDWIEDGLPVPGRKEAYTDEQGNIVIDRVCYASVQMPTLTCQLTQDLNDTDTVAYVNNTNGFYADKEKTVLIVATEAAYTTKTDKTFTLSAAWAGGLVPAGTRLYPLDAQGVKHDAWPIGTIGWNRKRYPLPDAYDWWASTIENPLMPGDDDWQSEWTQLGSATAGKLSKLTENLVDGAGIIRLDRTTGWPNSGLVYVYPPLFGGQPGPIGGYRAVKYTSKTLLSVTLEQVWDQGLIEAGARVGEVSLGGNLEGTSWTRAIQPIRARHLMLMINSMTDGGRGKMNSVHAWPDMASTTNPANQVDGSDAGDFVGHFLTKKFGLPASKYTQAASDVALPVISTQKASYMTVLRDLAKRTGCVLRFGRADGVRWRPKPEHPYGAQSGIEDDTDWTFGPEHGVLVQVTWGETRRTSQVRMKCMVSGTRDVWLAFYPAAPDEIGTAYQPTETIVVGTPLIGAQLAEVEYYKRSYPQHIRLSFRIPLSDWCSVIMRVGVLWPLDTVTGRTNRDVSGTYKVVTLDERTVGTFPTAYYESVLGLERLRNA